MRISSVGAFKWLSLMIVVLIVAAAVGCGKKAAETPTPTPTATPTATAVAEPTGETGTLSGLEGDVQVLRSGASSWIAATSGMRIGTGDNLKTGSNGYVLITFFDGSVMEVESDSEISVEELSKTSGGSTTVRIEQVIGSTLNHVSNMVDSSSTYDVETSAGSATVRGTIYRVVVSVGGKLTCVDVIDENDLLNHLVAFSGGGATVEVPEKKTSCCWEGGVPGAPFYTNPANDPLQFSSGGGGGCYGYGCGAQPTPTPTCLGEGAGRCQTSNDCCPGLDCDLETHTCQD